ncbi:MAG: FAD-binding protein [Lachnospiraceae bacterium]|nr:FAD-binding protein [Lachnospiraceae bacterium]
MHNLFAVGECASMYHGANRLGGNSLPAAVYSGNVARIEQRS